MDLYLIPLLFAKRAAGYLVNSCNVILDPYVLYEYAQKGKTINLLTIEAAEVDPNGWVAVFNINFRDRGTASPIVVSRPGTLYPTPEEAFMAIVPRIIKICSAADFSLIDLKDAKIILNEMEKFKKVYAQGSLSLPVDRKREVLRTDLYR